MEKPTTYQWKLQGILCVWTHTCTVYMCVNVLLHTSQRYGHSPMCDVISSEFWYWMFYYTHHSNMDTPQHAHVYVASGYFCYWMFYYTHHSNMDAPHCVHVDIFSANAVAWKFYYKHHRGTDAPQNYLQFTAITERFITHMTAMWMLASVYTLMYFQIMQ